MAGGEKGGLRLFFCRIFSFLVGFSLILSSIFFGVEKKGGMIGFIIIMSKFFFLLLLFNYLFL